MTSISKIFIALAIVIVLISTVVLIDGDNASVSMGTMVGSAKTEFPTIEDMLLSEFAEVSLDSGVNIVGISYYEDIDALVIGLEKRTYSDNEHLLLQWSILFLRSCL